MCPVGIKIIPDRVYTFKTLLLQLDAQPSEVYCGSNIYRAHHKMRIRTLLILTTVI